MTTRSFGRFALFGDASVAVAPEFLHIEAISTRSSRHEWTITAHTHPGIFQLLLLQSGSGVLVADQTTVALVPTAMVALPSGSIHAFAFEEAAEGWVLSMATPLVGDLALVNRAPGRGIAALGGACAASGITDRQSRRLDWLMGEIAADFTDHGAVHLSDVRLAMLTMLLAQCDEMLLQPQDRCAPPIGPPIGTQARHERLVQRFRAAVEAHFCAGWGLSRYAALLGTSTPTLTRACHSVLGRAPGEVVAARVQLEALRLLTYSALSISQIADQLGFADPAYFARFFKSRTGQTARAFRQERAWLQTA